MDHSCTATILELLSTARQLQPSRGYPRETVPQVVVGSRNILVPAVHE